MLSILLIIVIICTAKYNTMSGLMKKNELGSNIQRSEITKKTASISKPATSVVLPTPQSFYRIARECASTSNKKDASCQSCFNSSYQLLIQNEAICGIGNDNDNDTISIFIFIISTPTAGDRREAMRKTWLNNHAIQHNTGRVRYAFLVGHRENVTVSGLIERENDIYHDIIKASFYDTYRNLTLKTIMGLEWASTYCAHAGFVMKIDDDMWLNVFSLLSFVNRERSTLQTTLGGQCVSESQPRRNRNDKWYVSCEEYPFYRYPPYCSGTGYVTSMNVAKQVFDISRNIPFLVNEDAYIGICLAHLKLKTKSFKGFFGMGANFETCQFRSDHVITVHHVTPSKMLEVWDAKCT